MAKSTANGNQGGIADDQDELPIIAVSGMDVRDDDEDGIPTIEPRTLVTENAEGDPPRRGRGRPRGNSAKSASAKQATKEVANDLTGLLYSVHLMLSALTHVEELKLDKEESKQLADAVARVNSEFGGVVVSPKTAAIVNLVVAGGTVYGPRLMAYKIRLANEAQEKKDGARQQTQSIM